MNWSKKENENIKDKKKWNCQKISKSQKCQKVKQKILKNSNFLKNIFCFQQKKKFIKKNLPCFSILRVHNLTRTLHFSPNTEKKS